MNTMVKKISIMSLALAGLISPEKGMGADDTTPGQINQPSAKVSDWYKKLEASILKGDVCDKSGIFRGNSGAICKNKDAAELYLLICREKLQSTLDGGNPKLAGDKLMETKCGEYAKRFGSDFFTASEPNVIASTKKGFNNLYWLICTSKADTKNNAIARVKAAVCPAAPATSAFTTATPQAKQPGQAPTIGATRAPAPMEAAPKTAPLGTSQPSYPPVLVPSEAEVLKALKEEPKYTEDQVVKALQPLKGPDTKLSDTVKRDAIKIKKRKPVMIKLIEQAETTPEQSQQLNDLIAAAAELALAQEGMNEVLREMKAQSEAKNPPQQLNPPERNKIKQIDDELAEIDRQLLEHGIEFNERDEPLKRNEKGVLVPLK